MRTWLMVVLLTMAVCASAQTTYRWIDKEGKVDFNGKPASDEQLVNLLEEVRKVDRNTPVLIVADETTPLKRLAFVIDTCRKLGFNKFSLQTR